MSLAKLIIRQARTPRLLADGEVVTGRRLTSVFCAWWKRCGALGIDTTHPVGACLLLQI